VAWTLPHPCLQARGIVTLLLVSSRLCEVSSWARSWFLTISLRVLVPHYTEFAAFEKSRYFLSRPCIVSLGSFIPSTTSSAPVPRQFFRYLCAPPPLHVEPSHLPRRMPHLLLGLPLRLVKVLVSCTVCLVRLRKRATDVHSHTCPIALGPLLLFSGSPVHRIASPSPPRGPSPGPTALLWCIRRYCQTSPMPAATPGSSLALSRARPLVRANSFMSSLPPRALSISRSCPHSPIYKRPYTVGLVGL